MPNSGSVDHSSSAALLASNPMVMNPAQSNLFNHQISAYSYLVRNQPIPDQHLMIIRRHQQQHFYPPNATLAKQTSSPASMLDPRYNANKVHVNGTTPSRHYAPVNGHAGPPAEGAIHPVSRLNHSHVTSIAKPAGIDVQAILTERESRIQNNMLTKIHDLEKLLVDLGGDDLRTRVLIELKSLKLLHFQRQVRLSLSL